MAGRINETNFTRMMEKAQGEQETLQKKADMMRECLDGAAKEQEDNSKWLSLIRQYADIKELDRKCYTYSLKRLLSMRICQKADATQQWRYILIL